MTKSEAHALLNCARAGDDFTPFQITQALAVTGDLEDEFPICRVTRSVGSWERRNVPALLRRAEPFDGIAA
jgi:hypothetical protein